MLITPPAVNAHHTTCSFTPSALHTICSPRDELSAQRAASTSTPKPRPSHAQATPKPENSTARGTAQKHGPSRPPQAFTHPRLSHIPSFHTPHRTLAHLVVAHVQVEIPARRPLDVRVLPLDVVRVDDLSVRRRAARLECDLASRSGRGGGESAFQLQRARACWLRESQRRDRSAGARYWRSGVRGRWIPAVSWVPRSPAEAANRVRRAP